MDYRSILQVAEKNKLRALEKIKRLSTCDNDSSEVVNGSTIPSSAVQRQLLRQYQAKQMEKKRLSAEEAERLEQMREKRVREDKCRPKRGTGIYREYERLKMQREHDSLKATTDKMNQQVKAKESSEEEKMHSKFMQFVDAKSNSSSLHDKLAKSKMSSAAASSPHNVASIEKINMKGASSFEKAMAIANRNAALAEASLKKTATAEAGGSFFESLRKLEKSNNEEKRPSVDPSIIKKFMNKFNESQLNKYKARVPTLGEVVGGKSGKTISSNADEAPSTTEINDVKTIFDKFQSKEKSSVSKDAAEKRTHSTCKEEPPAKKVKPLSYMETLALAQKNMNRDILVQKIKEEKSTSQPATSNKSTGVVLADSSSNYDHGEVLRKRRLEREREALRKKTTQAAEQSAPASLKKLDAASKQVIKSKKTTSAKQPPSSSADVAAPTANSTVLMRLAQLEAEAAALRASLIGPSVSTGSTKNVEQKNGAKPPKVTNDRESKSSSIAAAATTMKQRTDDMSVSVSSVPGSLRQVITSKRSTSPLHHKKDGKKRSFAPRPYMPEDWESEEEEDEDLDDFIDDSEDAYNNYGKCIREIHKTLKFDPRKYASVKPWDDCRDMEVNRFSEIEKEDRRSSRLGALEDMAEERNQALKMARRVAKLKKGRVL